MPLPPYIVGKGIMFSGCSSTVFVHPSVYSSGQILPRYLVNSLNKYCWKCRFL